MKAKDRQELIEILRATQNEKLSATNSFPNNSIGNLVFKIISGVSLAMITWIFNSVNELKQDVSNMQLENGYTKRAVEVINDFVEKPRFTLDDYNQRTEPIIKQLNKNTTELNNRDDFMKDVENRLLKLEINNNNEN